MSPQIDPGSAKMAPGCLTPIDGNHFWDRTASKTTPSAPQAAPGVPCGTVWAPNGTQMGLKAPPGEPKRPPRGCKITLWVLPGSFGCCCCCRCRCSSSSVSSFVLCLLSLPFCLCVLGCRCSNFPCYALFFAPPRPRLNNPSARLLT